MLQISSDHEAVETAKQLATHCILYTRCKRYSILYGLFLHVSSFIPFHMQCRTLLGARSVWISWPFTWLVVWMEWHPLSNKQCVAPNVNGILLHWIISLLNAQFFYKEKEEKMVQLYQKEKETEYHVAAAVEVAEQWGANQPRLQALEESGLAMQKPNRPASAWIPPIKPPPSSPARRPPASPTSKPPYKARLHEGIGPTACMHARSILLYEHLCEIIEDWPSHRMYFAVNGAWCILN